MKAAKICLAFSGIFFLLLGLYFKFTTQVISSYDVYRHAGWRRTTMSGEFLIFLSLLSVGGILFLNKVAKEEYRDD
jgi:hypothetical protein